MMSVLPPDDTTLFLPQPFYLVIEDVGWWQGYNGSARNEPYRNNFPRHHCLADYKALRRLARKLSMRISIAMVLGEWDRTNFLKNIPEATWMGTSWNNRINQGPWLDQTAQFLRENEKYLEIALHGVCHEYWSHGRMQRSEFHDDKNHMRDPTLIRRHLDAYGELLHQNNLPNFPRLFVPPALHHSFGSGETSMQPLLYSYGIDHVTTRFDRARNINPPLHKALTWESSVGIVERGISPVNWDIAAAHPAWNNPGPIMALHWGNLLHPDPARSTEIVDAWAALILEKTRGPEYIVAGDLLSCWRQTAAYFLASILKEDNRLVIDLQKVPAIPCFTGSFFVRIKSRCARKYSVSGAAVLSQTPHTDSISTLELLPHKGVKTISFLFDCNDGV